MEYYLEHMLAFLDSGHLNIAWTHPVCRAAIINNQITIYELTPKSAETYELLRRRYPKLRVKFLRLHSTFKLPSPLLCEYAVLLESVVYIYAGVHDNIAAAAHYSEIHIYGNFKKLYLFVTKSMTHVYITDNSNVYELHIYSSNPDNRVQVYIGINSEVHKICSVPVIMGGKTTQELGGNYLEIFGMLFSCKN